MNYVRNKLATELVILKVCNVKLSFDIWLVLYMTSYCTPDSDVRIANIGLYFILFSFSFLFLFFIYFYFLSWELGLRFGVTSHVTVTVTLSHDHKNCRRF